jgi:hypothetical protein
MATRRPHLLIVGMSLLLAACGGASHKGSTVASGRLRAAVRHTLAQTEKVKLVANIELGSITMSLNGTGAFAPGQKAEINAQVSLPLTGTQPFDEVSVGGVSWVRSPALGNGDRWERAEKAPTLGLGLFPFEHPTALIEQLGAGGRPTVLGTDTIAGVKTTHYLTHIGNYPADAWVDGQNHVREVKVTIDATTGKQKVKATLTLTLSDFGAPVSVTPPVNP